MNIHDVPVPEIYLTSHDFRFFKRWFEVGMEKIQYDTENIPDLYDPQRCPADLLWMLADTMGFKYDTRLFTAFNRLVLLYFMSMIRLKGSKDGVTLAAEVNLAQFNLSDLAGGYEDEENNYYPGKDILYDRLEDTSIPVNSVYVTAHTAEGFIDVVYFSENVPIDACIEYVRPLGMYCFQQAGVRFDARTKISVDARLTDSLDGAVSIGPTHVGHYSREDYSRLQKMHSMVIETMGDASYRASDIDESHDRDPVYYRNSDYEDVHGTPIRPDPGYRAMYSLQLCNNEHVFQSLFPSLKKYPIFGLGRHLPDPNDPTKFSYVVQRPNSFVIPETEEPPVLDDSANSHFGQPNIGNPGKPWNLGYDRTENDNITTDIDAMDEDRSDRAGETLPRVNEMMRQKGDAIVVSDDRPNNMEYSKREQADDDITLEDVGPRP